MLASDWLLTFDGAGQRGAIGHKLPVAGAKLSGRLKTGRNEGSNFAVHIIVGRGSYAKVITGTGRML
jgi:hypothetical protein